MPMPAYRWRRLDAIAAARRTNVEPFDEPASPRDLRTVAWSRSAACGINRLSARSINKPVEGEASNVHQRTANSSLDSR